MSIVDPDIAGGAGAPAEDGGLAEGAVACPHCSAPVGEGVFPWPPEPTRCPACGQWIGRNRASTGLDADAAPPVADSLPAADAPPAADIPQPTRGPEARERSAEQRARRRERGKKSSGFRMPGFLGGRRDAEPAKDATAAEAAPPAAEHAPPAAEDREPVTFAAPPDPAAIEEPAATGEPSATEEPATDEPPAIDEPSATEEPSAPTQEPSAADEPRTEVDAPTASGRAATPPRAPRPGSLMRRSRMRRLMSTFGLAEPPERSRPSAGGADEGRPAADEAAPGDRSAAHEDETATFDEPAAYTSAVGESAADEDDATIVDEAAALEDEASAAEAEDGRAGEYEPADRDAVLAEVDEPDAFADEPVAAEPDAAVAEDDEPVAFDDEPAVADAADEDEPSAIEDEPTAAEAEAVVEDEDEPVTAGDEADADEPVTAEYQAVADTDEAATGVDEPVAAEEAVAYEEEPDDEPAAFEDEPLAEDEDEPGAEPEPVEEDEPIGADDGEPPAAAAEPEPDEEEDEDEFADEDDRQRALRTVAAQVAVARLASGKAAPTRMPSLPRRPQKLQPPRVTLPRRRPAPSKASPASPIKPGATTPSRAGAGRYAGITMVVVGILILAYGTITLVWQDPWTAWQTARAQKRAKVQYEKIVKDFRKSARLQTKQATRAWLHRQAALFNLNTPEGSPVGRLSIPKIDVHFTIVQGTEESTLSKGPAHYVETPLPGAKGKWTVGIAGHRTTYLAPFRRLNELDPGDHITIQMPYARFSYVVEKTKIVDATDQTVLAADSAITGRKPYNRLALTACHPPFSAAQRIIVYSRLMRYNVAKARS